MVSALCGLYDCYCDRPDGLSLVGDFFMKGRVTNPHSEGENRTGQFFRVAGLHIQSDLDPFSKTFIALEFKPDEIELGEAFLDWTGLVPSLNTKSQNTTEEINKSKANVLEMRLANSCVQNNDKSKPLSIKNGTNCE